MNNATGALLGKEPGEDECAISYFILDMYLCIQPTVTFIQTEQSKGHLHRAFYSISTFRVTVSICLNKLCSA